MIELNLHANLPFFPPGSRNNAEYALQYPFTFVRITWDNEAKKEEEEEDKREKSRSLHDGITTPR